jgi:hypothetical protein
MSPRATVSRRARDSDHLAWLWNLVASMLQRGAIRQAVA